MTKEEALEILDWILTKGEEVDALEMAIKALQEQIVWHPYPKESPTDVGEHLVTINGKVTIEDATYYEYSGTYQFDSQGVTAWAELPKPYQEGTDNE